MLKDVATLLAPELTIIGTALAVLALDLAFPSEKRPGKKSGLVYLGLASVLIALALVVAGMSLEPREIFGGRFLINPFSGWLKVVFLLATALTLTSGVEFLRNKAEFVTVLLLSLSGMLFLTSSRDLVLLYVSLELATLPLVALAAWKQTARGGEAGF